MPRQLASSRGRRSLANSSRASVASGARAALSVSDEPSTRVRRPRCSAPRRPHVPSARTAHRSPSARRASALAAHQESTRALAEQAGAQAALQPARSGPAVADAAGRDCFTEDLSPRARRCAPSPPARQHSASATASPPSAMSWALESAPARTASRTASWAARTASMSTPSSPSGSGWPRSLASSLARQRRVERPDERDRLARALEAQPPGPARVGQPADHADHRRRVDRAGGALVVEGHVAADDRRPERAAGVAEAAHRLGQLPGDVRLLGVAEVEVVGRAQRLGADAGEVGGALEHRRDRPPVGVGGDAAAVAVDAHRQGGHRPALLRRTRSGGQQRQHGRVGLLGPAHGARLHDRVVLLEQGPARGECWRWRAAPAASRPGVASRRERGRGRLIDRLGAA